MFSTIIVMFADATTTMHAHRKMACSDAPRSAMTALMKVPSMFVSQNAKCWSHKNHTIMRKIDRKYVTQKKNIIHQDPCERPLREQREQSSGFSVATALCYFSPATADVAVVAQMNANMGGYGKYSHTPNRIFCTTIKRSSRSVGRLTRDFFVHVMQHIFIRT